MFTPLQRCPCAFENITYNLTQESILCCSMFVIYIYLKSNLGGSFSNRKQALAIFGMSEPAREYPARVMRALYYMRYCALRHMAQWRNTRLSFTCILLLEVDELNALKRIDKFIRRRKSNGLPFVHGAGWVPVGSIRNQGPLAHHNPGHQ
jgi:hypothetical protein